MDKEALTLSEYRIQQAEQCLMSSKILCQVEDYRGAANRSYYAIFHAMRSVLALESKDFAKHSGVSSYFRKTYIKSGIFPIEMSDYITSAFEARSDSDYDDFYVISKSDVEIQIANAEKFCRLVKDYLESRK